MLAKPGLFLRLIVIIYDALLLAGVVYAASALLYLVSQIFPDTVNALGVVKLFKFILLIGVSFFFYGWFWVHGGQTLGMKAWHLYLVNDDSKFISWKVAAIRYGSAVISWLTLGLGFTWILVNKNKAAWHDLISQSYIVKHKPANNAENQKQSTPS